MRSQIWSSLVCLATMNNEWMKFIVGNSLQGPSHFLIFCSNAQQELELIIVKREWVGRPIIIKIKWHFLTSNQQFIQLALVGVVVGFTMLCGRSICNLKDILSLPRRSTFRQASVVCMYRETNECQTLLFLRIFCQHVQITVQIVVSSKLYQHYYCLCASWLCSD